ncbi:MAG TPA: NAD-dependent epimerase/dehydratase family protein [Acidiferrobacteraceae bacterium]|nr:NAD-dependent epimerase/dehydratase family protein [Acidiferrobacteraceae bacterium]
MKVLVFGGGGFVGRHLAAHLAPRGVQVTVCTRAPQKHRDLLVLPGLRMLSLQSAERAALLAEMAAADGVVNLTGIWRERRAGDYARAHVDFPRELGELCRMAGVRRLIHVSAAGAAPDAASRFLRSRWQGEAAITAGFPEAVVLRPALVYGRDDPYTQGWVRALGGYARIVPVPAAERPLAPLYVGDLVRVIEQALDDRKGPGRYDLCGPVPMALKAWVQYLADVLGQRVRLWPLAPRASRILGRLPLPLKCFGLERLDTLSEVPCASPWPERFLPRPLAPAAVLPSCLS